MEQRVGREATLAGRVAALLSMLTVLVVFAVVVAGRWRDHFSNVDDYLYALQTGEYLDGLAGGPHGLARAWRRFGSSSPLVPMLALPIAVVSISAHALVLVQIIPLFVLLVSSRILLRDLGSSDAEGWWAAAAITSLPPVMSYAGMYHFAPAAAACTTLSAAAYSRSNQLRHRRWALLFGLALGLLSLTRVIAPVYIAALLVPIAIDLVFCRADRPARLRNGVSAALVAGLGPTGGSFRAGAQPRAIGSEHRRPLGSSAGSSESADRYRADAPTAGDRARGEVIGMAVRSPG